MRIVEAIGSATAGRSANAKGVEQAMAAAVQACMDAGITDGDAIRDAQMKARAEFKASLQDQPKGRTDK